MLWNSDPDHFLPNISTEYRIDHAERLTALRGVSRLMLCCDAVLVAGRVIISGHLQRKCAAMANLNKVMLMGNLTRDVEMRAVREGSSVGKFALAINRNYTLASGEKREEVTFIECEAWGKTAEIIAKYVTKGRPLFVEGRLKQDTWTDKDNNKRTAIKVVVENFQFIGGPREGGSQQSYSGDGEPARSGGGNWSRGNNNSGNNFSEPEPQPSAGDDIPF